MLSADNRRIAKNTLALYLRMGVTMLVSLFTSRVVLQTLGVEDFGIYNVVGGVVVLFSFLNAAMSSATQRFLNFELGRGNVVQAGRVFSMSMSVHFVIAGTVLVLAETLGLWFLNTQLNIPEARMAAANWCYQFSVASTLLGIMLVPYNATIIAYERMTFYAWASIATTLLRLGIVYLLLVGNADKLMLYAALTFAVGVLMQIVHVVYCRRAFPQTARYKPFRDKNLFCELISFSGWSLILGISNLASTQGVNMVFNIFYGVVLNTAVGISTQVNAAVYQLCSNFQAAYSPQIVKRYSSSDREGFFSLIFYASKISFLLLALVAVPVIANTEFILSAWLGTYPEHTVEFVRLTLLFSLVDTLVIPLAVGVQANGKIRNYQLLCSIFIITNLPIAFLILHFGFSPEYVFCAKIVLNILSLIWRVFYLKGLVGLPVRDYFCNVIIRLIPVFLLNVFCAGVVVETMSSSWTTLVCSILASCISLGVGFFCFGMKKEERNNLVKIISTLLKKYAKI